MFGMSDVCRIGHAVNKKFDMYSFFRQKDNMSDFDARKFIKDLFGSYANLHDDLERAGFTDVPKVDSIGRWARRGSIPGEWLARILWLRERELEPVELSGYMTPAGGVFS